MCIRAIQRLAVSGALGLGLILLGLPLPGLAQAVGSVEGTVVATGTQRPLVGAQVTIEGTGLGTLVQSGGTFSISNVPVGEHTVRVTMLGYARGESRVSVSEGEVAIVNFQLTSQALALDELVVTGTAGGTQRRAIGNVVDRLDASEVLEVTPVTNVSQLIGQRAPGVQIQPSTGQVGAGAPIHIRGISSLSLGSTPLIYIDGVRMDSRHGLGPGARGGAPVSRLDDLNPEDIESIEIIKGPAAATLYGTEASNGVIQIITRRGAEGRHSFDAVVRLGTSWIWDPEGRQGFTYAGNPHQGQLDSINIYAHERDLGLGDPFGYGNIQGYSLSASGGMDAIRYFASIAWNDETGVFDYNWQKRLAARSNVDFIPTDALRVQVGLGYVQRTYRGAQRTLATDAFGNMTWGSPAFLNTRTRGYRNAPPEASAEVDARSELDRITANIEIGHNPASWFTHRLVSGVDVGVDENYTLYPRHPDGTQHFWGGLSLGNKTMSKETNRIVTLDYGASATWDVTPSLNSSTSAGLQYYRRTVSSLGGSASDFAAPPLTTISAGATTAGNESFLENASVGVYFQQQFGWQDRVFITGAIRADDNSAFGADFDAAIYPKISGTWVVHEEDFWRWDWVDQFRLRGAWGAAGQQPDAFAAVRLYAPVTGFNDEPGLQPSAIGNPDLSPERSYEVELGFDAAFLNDRLQVVFTRYDRTVRDAMVNRPLPDSEGFPGTQIVNIGEVSAWGNELQVDYRAVESPRLSWDIGVGFATMRNRIESLGEVGSIGTGAARQIEGYSINDQFWRRVVSADFVSGSFGPVTNIMCDGGTGLAGLMPGGDPVPCDDAPWVFWGRADPTWQATVTQTLGIGANLRLFASVDANGGHIRTDLTPPAAHTSYCISRACRFQDDPIFQSYRAIGRNPLGMYDAGFARLREVSATYTLPSRWASQMGANRASVSFSMRNLMMLWTAQHGWNTPRSGGITIPLGEGRVWDPEIRSQGAGSTFQTVLPPTATAVFTVRMSF